MRIQRYRCRSCATSFSEATWDVCVHQNKRHVNTMVGNLLCSANSQRRTAKVLKINRKTVVRKLLFLSRLAIAQNELFQQTQPQATIVEFDDLITIEHTKCKPLAVTTMVEYPTRRILGFEVSQIPASGPLAKKAVKKYGRRPDGRRAARRRLFERVRPLIAQGALIKSDEEPHYRRCVEKFFPDCTYRQFKSAKSAVAGQGELKKRQFDPIFSINHTLAMLRANVNRLIRQTWCTTKRTDRLVAHLHLYAAYHNTELIDQR